MFEVTDLMLNTESVPSNISYKSFKTKNLPMQNSYCDHRNFDSVTGLVSPIHLPATLLSTFTLTRRPFLVISTKCHWPSLSAREGTVIVPLPGRNKDIVVE